MRPMSLIQSMLASSALLILPQAAQAQEAPIHPGPRFAERVDGYFSAAEANGAYAMTMPIQRPEADMMGC